MRMIDQKRAVYSSVCKIHYEVPSLTCVPYTLLRPSGARLYLGSTCQVGKVNQSPAIGCSDEASHHGPRLGFDVVSFRADGVATIKLVWSLGYPGDLFSRFATWSFFLGIPN